MGGVEAVCITLRRDGRMCKAARHPFTNSSISFSSDVEIINRLMHWKVDLNIFPTVYGLNHNSISEASYCFPKVALC